VIIGSVVLLTHVIGVLVVFIGMAVEWLSLESLRRATASEQTSPWVRLHWSAPRVDGAAFAVLLLSGIYLGEACRPGVTPWRGQVVVEISRWPRFARHRYDERRRRDVTGPKMSGPLPSETDEERFRRVAVIFETANFLRTLGVRLEAVGPDSCETSLLPTPALYQQHGFVHGGVITTLADHTAGGAARAAVPPGRDVLTLELKINFLRPGRGARLVARARTLRAGRSTVVSESEVFEITDGQERLVATLSSTLMIVDERPFAEAKEGAR
jgi:uncharacterized protein (TIGR00369 family)